MYFLLIYKQYNEIFLQQWAIITTLPVLNTGLFNVSLVLIILPTSKTGKNSASL